VIPKILSFRGNEPATGSPVLGEGREATSPMTEYEQTLKVKEDAEARLRTIPGVHAVGISKKVVAGEPTGELCVVDIFIA
jgi:hypothetical protein